MTCSYCGEEVVTVCRECGQCDECCDCEVTIQGAAFDRDELGIDPEDDYDVWE